MTVAELFRRPRVEVCAIGDFKAPKMGACKSLPAILTRQERRVLELVSKAKTNKEIAFTLAISPATVKRHLENILKKLRLRNRVEAAVYVVRLEDHPQETEANLNPKN